MAFKRQPGVLRDAVGSWRKTGRPGRTVPAGRAGRGRQRHKRGSTASPRPPVSRVTDGGNSGDGEPIVGILPDLFREGQGVVTLGTLLQPDGTFAASEVLAKHDETYMPKEVEEALKKSGHWNPASGPPPPPAATWNTAAPKGAGG
jgi:cytochrome c-type biogenesis protein CcmE